ncbi:response regulator [bacterium]|nr:MAG: response regulator [bacterium]
MLFMANESAKIRILHVDDEPDTLLVIKTILEKEGYDVTSALSGSEALKQVDMDGFSLIILDIMMPDMSGWDLFTRIAKIKPDYRVIFLSVIDVPEEKLKEIRSAGIRDYIKKPFDRDDFVSRVKKILAE